VARALRNGIRGDQAPFDGSRKSAGNHAGDVSNGFRREGARLAGLSISSPSFQEAVPFFVQVQRLDLRERHRQQVRVNIRELFPIPLDRFASQFPFGVFSKEIFEKFAECFREGTSGSPAFSSSCLCCSRMRRSASAFSAAAFVANPDCLDLAAIAPVGAGEVDDETPRRLAVMILPLN